MNYIRYLNSEVCSEVEQDITVECVSEKYASLLNKFRIYSTSFEYKPGCIEHIGRCVELAMANQKIACIKEKELNSDYSSCEIIADVELKNICLFVKGDYVCVDYEMLAKNDKKDELSEFLHLFLLCKITAGTMIYSSPVFTLVKRCEAENINLEFQDENSIKFFDCLSFSKCRSTSKVDFNLYCITIKSKLSMGIDKNPKVENPLKSNENALQNNQNRLIIPCNIGKVMISKSDIKSNIPIIRKNMTNKKIEAYIKLKVFWSFHLTSTREYRLNIHTDINGVISLTPMICKITYKGLRLREIEKSTGNVENEDIEIPFDAFGSKIAISDNCKGYESQTCFVFLIRDIEKMPTDQDNNRKYLAALTESSDDANSLCKMINDCRDSFQKWFGKKND